MGSLGTGRVQGCTVPTGWKYEPFPGGERIVINPTPPDVWVVKAGDAVILFNGELEALRWIVRNGNTGEAFRAKFGERIEMA